MKDELTTKMRASVEKHFSKPTRLTDFYLYLFIYLFIIIIIIIILFLFLGGGGILLSIWVNIYFSKPLRLLDNLILMQ